MSENGVDIAEEDNDSLCNFNESDALRSHAPSLPRMVPESVAAGHFSLAAAFGDKCVLVYFTLPFSCYENTSQSLLPGRLWPHGEYTSTIQTMRSCIFRGWASD